MSFDQLVSVSYWTISETQMLKKHRCRAVVDGILPVGVELLLTAGSRPVGSSPAAVQNLVSSSCSAAESDRDLSYWPEYKTVFFTLK